MDNFDLFFLNKYFTTMLLICLCPTLKKSEIKIHKHVSSHLCYYCKAVYCLKALHVSNDITHTQSEFTWIGQVCVGKCAWCLYIYVLRFIIAIDVFVWWSMLFVSFTPLVRVDRVSLSLLALSSVFCVYLNSHRRAKKKNETNPHRSCIFIFSFHHHHHLDFVAKRQAPYSSTCIFCTAITTQCEVIKTKSGKKRRKESNRWEKFVFFFILFIFFSCFYRRNIFRLRILVWISVFKKPKWKISTFCFPIAKRIHDSISNLKFVFVLWNKKKNFSSVFIRINRTSNKNQKKDTKISCKFISLYLCLLFRLCLCAFGMKSCTFQPFTFKNCCRC